MKISGNIAEGMLSVHNWKYIAILLNILCQQQFKETSVEVLLDCYSPTPYSLYHYATAKVGHLPPFSVPCHLPSVKCPLLVTFPLG